MASKAASNPTDLELTEVESRLRQLLLDVAAYIDESNSSSTTESSVKVPDQLAKQKVVLRFTGGWVRDKLLGVGSHDIDVAINKMTGEHFGLKMVEYLEKPGNVEKYGLEPPGGNGKGNAKEKSRKVAPGLYKIKANPEKSKHLETAMTKIMGIDLDLVNLRKETYTENNRNPQIEFGTPEEDAMRRDATVNAMFYNLNTSKIEDFTGRGFEDMGLKIIRTPLEPYQTFKDDPLRVLRLIRFASRLNYTIDSKAEEAMGNKDIQAALRKKIRRERVGIELEKMLKGPDPPMALGLIDRLDLYETIFTDPTRDFEFKPETKCFARAYSFVDSLLAKKSLDMAYIVPDTLARNEEEQYIAWICAALMPWADSPMVPHQKPTQLPFYAATLVAREGFKAPNKICDVITTSLRNSEEIRGLVGRCHTQLKNPHSKHPENDATARDTLGMAIRRWGPTWRSQVLFSLVYDVVLETGSPSMLCNSYSAFLKQLTEHGILEAYSFKPLLTGADLMKALNVKSGPWMKEALDIVMAWQLRNPGVTDTSEAFEAVNASRDSPSELPSALTSHFLKLTIRSLFAPQHIKSTTPGNHSPSRTQKPEWKDEKNSWWIDLMEWILTSALDTKSVRANWGLLFPPIAKLLDDGDLKWKSYGCALLTLLLKITPQKLLLDTQLDKGLERDLMPLFTFLPTLTDESESIMLLEQVFPAVLALADTAYPPNSSSKPTSLSTVRERFLDKLLRDGILAPLFHAQPASYPRLATTLLPYISPLERKLGIDSVKHLQTVLPLLSSILAEPLGPTYPPLMKAAAKALQTTIQTCWPRIFVHRGEVIKGSALGWIHCCEEETKGDEQASNMKEVKDNLLEVVRMLDFVLVDREETREVWLKEKADLVKANELLRELFKA